jgi:hypothetical protein
MWRNTLINKSYTLGLWLLVLIAFLSLSPKVEAQMLVWYDDLTNFPTNWNLGGSSGPWSKSSTYYTSSSYSAKCTPDSVYHNNQNNWMERNVNLTGFQFGAVVFSIWQKTVTDQDYVCFECYDGNWTTYWMRAGGFPEFQLKVIPNIPSSVSKIRFRFLSDSAGTDEGVYLDDIYVYGYRYDVGCSLIVVPTGTIDSGQVVTPQALLYNYGDFISTFTVRMQIGSFYTYDQTVTDFEPKTSRTVYFTSWTARPRGTWAVSCSTRHPADYDRTNDKKTTTVTVRVRDVGATSIIAPSGTIDSGTTVVPQARVRNYGTTSETFDVRFTISPAYSSLRNITLAAGESLLVNFDNWIALPRGTLTTRCTTALNGDMLSVNNLKTGNVTVRVRDVGVTEIIAPNGNTDSVQSIIPRAKVKNYGTNVENLTAKFLISGGSGNWINTKSISSLNPGEERTITFDPWTAGPRGSYTTKCSTALAGDQVNSNNELFGNFILQVHDVGVTTINLSTANDSTAIVPVSAVVMNYGTYPETFSVRFKIGSFYTNTQTTTLAPNTSGTVFFDNWTVVQPRGSYATKCSTLLSSDGNPNNDYQSGSVMVNVHDVGVVTIVSPVLVDSSATATVSASVQNFGTSAETFTICFRIGDFYVSNRTTTLNSNTSTLITFDDWLVSQWRGSYSTSCSTFLSIDVNPSNNFQNGEVAVNVHDVGVVTIISPLTADSSQTVLVIAQVMNYGNCVESTPIRFQIGSLYSNTQTITINPNGSQIVDFVNWTVAQARGSYGTKCSTLLNNDVNRANDFQSGSITIGVHDVGLMHISALPQTVDSGSTVQLNATVSNCGTYQEEFEVSLSIGCVYLNTDTLVLNPGDSAIANFPDWQALTRNGNRVECRTILSVDANPENNSQTGNIFVTVRDIGVIGILSPSGSVYQGTTIHPTTAVKNLGNIFGSCSVWFKIVQNESTYYETQLPVDLTAGALDTVRFPSFLIQGLGDFRLITYSDWSTDMNQVNDTIITDILVVPYTAWIQMNDLPVGVGKRVKNGGSLVYVPENSIYALKGNNTTEFFRYSIENNEWDSISPLPFGEKPKGVKSGAALTYGNGSIYALKGNNTLEFWRYSIAFNHWFQPRPVPLGLRRKRIKGGSGMVFVNKGDSTFVYLLKGSRTCEFFAYWVDGDTWFARDSALATSSGKGFNKGSALTLAGDKIYAIKGKTNEFYAYDLLTDQWEEKARLPIVSPLGKKKKVSEGAALTFDGDNLIYAFKGGNSDEFWSYDIAGDTWLTQMPIPRLPSNKRVKPGGALTFANSINRIFALKGGNTLELWMYVPTPMDMCLKHIPAPPQAAEGIAGETKPLKINGKILIAPNPFSTQTKVSYQFSYPGPTLIKLYDTNGRLLKKMDNANNTGIIVLNSRGLKNGVYILMIENGEKKVFRKLVLTKD